MIPGTNLAGSLASSWYRPQLWAWIRIAEEDAMDRAVINLQDKLGRFDDLWAPRVVAELNDYQFKLVKLDGEFIWHYHKDTDEAFLVIEGRMAVAFRDGTATLGPGDLFVVPKGMEHKTSAPEPCSVLIIEPKGIPNTGEAGGDRTAANDVWI